jgi:hypothetical protein
VLLHWESAFAVGFQLQISGDAETWRTVHENYAGDGAVDTIQLSSGVSGRYLKVYMFNKATDYGYSLYEIQAYA